MVGPVVPGAPGVPGAVLGAELVAAPLVLPLDAPPPDVWAIAAPAIIAAVVATVK